MAATERRRGRTRGRRRFVREIPWLAAGLGTLAARDAVGQSTLDARFLFYKESAGRTQVIDPMVLLHQDFGETKGQLNLQLGFDAISGASPSGGYPTSDVVTSASGHTRTNGSVPQVEYQDTRESGTLSYTRRFGAHLPTIDVSYAKENDYIARGAGFSDSWTMAEGRGTLHFGASFSRDVVEPVTNKLSLAKATNSASLGWTWIVGERDLFDVSASLMRLSGYLDDPYKVVPVGPIGTTETLPDHRPDARSRWAVVGKYGHHFTWDGALKVTYRYYTDDWSVHAHTLEAVYDHHVESDWIVSPQVRLYTQTGASFYTSLLAAPETYRSADYRLSPLYNVLGGLTVTHALDEQLSLSLGATYQSQVGRDRVVPIAMTPQARGAPTTSAADMTVITVTAGVSWRF